MSLPCTKFCPIQITFSIFNGFFIRHFPFLNFLPWISSQRLQKPPSTWFHQSQVTFCIFVRHFEFLNFDFRFMTFKTPKYQISSGLSNFLDFCPPYLIYHFEFLKFVFKIVISDLKNPYVPNFIKIK